MMTEKQAKKYFFVVHTIAFGIMQLMVYPEYCCVLNYIDKIMAEKFVVVNTHAETTQKKNIRLNGNNLSFFKYTFYIQQEDNKNVNICGTKVPRKKLLPFIFYK